MACRFCILTLISCHEETHNIKKYICVFTGIEMYGQPSLLQAIPIIIEGPVLKNDGSSEGIAS